jgi:hypothetical protein
MGIRSWFRSRQTSGAPDDSGDSGSGGHSLIKLRYEDPALESVEEAAAADVARVEEDAKYFGRNTPADEDEL